jgi:hypothetical protein
MLNWFRRNKTKIDSSAMQWHLVAKEPKTRAIPPEKDQCSFCRKRSSKVKKLFAGSADARICNECLEVCEEILGDHKENPQNAPGTKGLSDLACSFCLKSADDVQHLIAGPTVYICGDCALRFQQSTN